LFFDKELKRQANHPRPFLKIQSKEEHLDKLVETFWMDQSTPHDDDLAKPIQDDLLLEKIKKLLTPSGKLQIPCLWKTKCPTLKNNFELAKKRLFSLLLSKLITTTSNFLDDYSAIFKKWEKANYIEQINNPYPHRQGMWYSPHFPVVRMHKETTKIRPVFNCAAKYQGLSLNDCLMQGPQVINELVRVLHGNKEETGGPVEKSDKKNCDR
jgi:hypothetical protein